jgi:anti-sigma B factor antagonist
MSFSLKTRRPRGGVLVDMSGRLSAGESVRLLRNTVKQLAEKGSQEFVLNLEDISYVDSCGLGELVTIYTSLKNKGCSVSLLNPFQRPWNSWN